MNNTLSYRGYTGSIETDLDDYLLHGEILFINDLVTYGAENLKDLQAAFEQAVEEYIAACTRHGKEPNKPFSGSFNVRIGEDRHRKAAVTAAKLGEKLNEFVSKSIDLRLEGVGSSTAIVRHEHHHTVRINIASQDVPFSSIPESQAWQANHSHH